MTSPLNSYPRLSRTRRRFSSSAFALTSLLTLSAFSQEEVEVGGEAEDEVPEVGGVPAEADAGSGSSDESEPKAGPKIVAPELKHYEPPVFPEKAFAEGREAVVQLYITVQADGSVKDPEVAAPKGHGFDEAAMKAALGLKFSPATVDGEPKSVRIGFEYAFTIEEKAAASEAEEQPETPTVGEIGGTLLVAGVDAPLPGVEIQLTDGLGAVYSATSGADGKWSLEAMAPGKYQLLIAAEGFDEVRSEEEIFAGEGTDIVLRLSVASDELEVVVRGERPPREVTRRTLERREIQRIPGTSGDALRSIQSLPGVARPPGLAGLLIVRGSAPGDTGTFIDGEEVPLIYHFGGLSSVVPTELLDKIDFYPGNFSVRYGRYRGGIVDAGLRAPNTDCYGDYGAPTNDKGCYHGMAQADFIDSRLLIQGPVPGTDDWSFALAGRRSHVDVLLKPVLEAAGTSVISAPVYHDYQAIVERNRGPDDKLSFRVFGSDDNLRLLIEDPAAQDPGIGGNLTFGTAFTRAQVLYQKALTRKTNIDAMVSVGTQRIDFELGGNLKFKLDSIPVDVRSEIGHKIHETAKINVGFDFLSGPFDVFVRAPPPPRPGEASSESLSTQVSRETSSSGFAFRPAWYTDLEWQPLARLRVVPGVRLDYARDSGHADISPRLTARYSLFTPEDQVWDGRTTTLKGGVGKFAQPPTFQETDPVFGTEGIESNNSVHYSFGVEQGLTEQVEISVEGYYKDFYNSVGRAAGPGGGFVYNNEGSGRVVGMETLLKYKPDDRFFGWVAYTLSQSVRQECDSCEERAFQYDQTHNLIVLGSYRLGRGWEFGGRFRIVSGPLTTPVVGSLYAGDSGTYIPLAGEPFSERLPLFHQLDLRVDKNWQFRTWKLGAYLDIQNVYNNAAAEAYVYNYNFSQRAYQTGLPVIPSLGLRGEF